MTSRLEFDRVIGAALKLAKRINEERHNLTITDLADVFGAERVWPLFELVPFPSVRAETLREQDAAIKRGLHHFDQAAQGRAPLAGALGQSAVAEQLKQPKANGVVLVMAKDRHCFYITCDRLQREKHGILTGSPILFVDRFADLFRPELEHATSVYVILTTSAGERVDYHDILHDVNLRAKEKTSQIWQLIDIRKGVHVITLPIRSNIADALVATNRQREEQRRFQADGRAVYNMVRGVSRRGFVRDVAAVINQSSRENRSGTPDWVLAEFLEDVLTAFETAVQRRQRLPRKKSGVLAGAR